MNLQKRTARLIQEKIAELSETRKELERLIATQALKVATQYALDFAAPEESVILRSELEHEMTEDLYFALELEEGQVAALIQEAIDAHELHAYGDEYIQIPTRTFRSAKMLA